MRKILFFAATAATMALGADAAYAISPSPTPEQSPYAILEPQSALPSALPYMGEGPMSEGRAAATGDRAYGRGRGFYPALPYAPQEDLDKSHGR